MKTCPSCGAHYDNETLLFCTRDGSPLVPEGSPPEFTDMPSESWEEDTVVLSKPPASPAPSADAKIIVPTAPEPAAEQKPPFAHDPIRPVPPYQPPPQKPRIGLTILLTALSTIAIIALAIAAWWGLNGGSGNNLPVNGNLDANLLNANSNANLFNVNSNFNVSNINANANLNANVNFNFNANTNSNVNVNVNANANVNKPTPTPKPTATPKPTPSETPDNDDDDDPSPTPRPPSSPGGTPRSIDAGVLNSRAVSLPRPAYPQAARTVGATGSVNVSVLVDEQGNVVSAKATSGHPLLKAAAEAAARQARFNPPRMGNQSVKMSGVLLYSFQQ